MLQPPPAAQDETYATLEARSSRLQRGALAFCRMLSPESAASQLLDLLMEVPSAYAGIVAIRESEEDLRAVHLRGYPGPIAEKLAHVSFRVSLPVVDAARTGKPIFMSTADEFHATYPNCGAPRSVSVTHAIAALPLIIEGRVLGAVAVSFNLPMEFTPDIRGHLETIAAMAAQCFERAHLFSEMQLLNDRYGAAISVGGLGLWEWDLGTGKVHCYGHFRELMGEPDPSVDWSPEKFLLKVHPEDRAEIEARAARAFSGSLPEERNVFRILWPDGSCHWLATGWRRVTGPDGAPKMLRGVMVDITLLKETEQQLQRSVRIRDDFLAMASHELKTPLTALKLHLELLQMELEAEAGSSVAFERVRSVAHQSDRMQNLIDQLLDVSRIQTGKLPFQFESFDLGACSKALGKRYSEELNRADANRFSFVAPESLPMTGDRLRLEQLIDNLIANSVRHGDHSPIRFGVERDGDAVRITVSDEGPGISKEQQTRIFGRFEQATPGRTLGGLGLGLYIVREIVSAHQGRIEVRSAPGEGTSFTVTLPIAGPGG